MKIVSKGAMFGLDARIALAIFGALSVISGAALYSAIQSAQTEQWRQNFEEHLKASNAYYLDTGEQLEIKGTGTYNLYSGDIVSNNRNSLTQWKGPYISDTMNSTTTLVNEMTKKIHSSSLSGFYLRTISSWSEANDMSSDGHCVINSSDCAEWFMLSSGDSSASAKLFEIFNKLDSLVDNGDGPLSGKVRYNTYQNDYLFYQGRPRKIFS